MLVLPKEFLVAVSQIGDGENIRHLVVWAVTGDATGGVREHAWELLVVGLNAQVVSDGVFRESPAVICGTVKHKKYPYWGRSSKAEPTNLPQRPRVQVQFATGGHLGRLYLSRVVKEHR